MIRLFSKGVDLEPSSLVGRIVLVDGRKHWPSLAQPRRVLAATGRRLTVERLPLRFVPDGRGPGRFGFELDTRDREIEPDSMLVSSVLAACDTAEEAIALVHADEDAGDEFKALRARAAAALEALASGGRPAPATRKVTLVTNEDDWEGAYVDGVLVAQGHPPLGDGLQAVANAFGGGYARVTVDRAWMNAQGELPRDLADVQLESPERITGPTA